MSKLLRYYKEGNTYFITIITNDRKTILVENNNLLRASISKYERELEFSIAAWVILPDHFHIVIDPKKNNLSSIIQKVKLSFSKKYRYRSDKWSGYVWQSRFWDHVIRDQKDMNNHIDYIHYNPVKHGYVKSPFLWNLSSIHDYAKLGYYAEDWGVSEELAFDGDYGE
jgi:putative transposase